MKLTAPYIWIMTSGVYDVLQIWDQAGSVSYFDIYANGVKVYTLNKDDDISYVTIESLNLPTKCEPSHGYNIGVIGYDSDGNSTEDSNEVCWYSDGEFDNDGADPDIIAPFKAALSITFYLDGVQHGTASMDKYSFSEDGSSTDITVLATRNSYNNGVTLIFDGSWMTAYSYDYKTPITEVVTVSSSTLSSSSSSWSLSVYASSSNTIRYKFRRHAHDTDIENSTAKARRYGDFTAPTDCIAFVSDTGNFTLKAYQEWDGTVEYSTDRITWTTWDGSAIASSAQKLYLRGYDNTTFYTTVGSRFSLSAPARCYGNINTLLQYDEPPITISASRCFGAMFDSCTNLTQAPELPATTLANYCYDNMFYGCTSLTQAPELPATTLADRCYQYMFTGCTSLTQAPKLPATTLSSYCYSNMFKGCASLTQAPELPATELPLACYRYMFYSCTSLTQAPKLPAATLSNECYRYMFQGCTSLTQVPELPATTLANYCYSNMFYGCASLTQAPKLPASTLADGCYQYMFKGCTSLTQAPELPATTLPQSCYSSMFQGCTSLTQAPELPATTLALNCYVGIFQGCTSLTQAPKLSATTLADRCYVSMFYDCTKIKLSATQTGTYTQTYRIPTSGTGTIATSALLNMFGNTGGTFTGSPRINTTYYLDESCTIV